MPGEMLTCTQVQVLSLTLLSMTGFQHHLGRVLVGIVYVAHLLSLFHGKAHDGLS